MKYIYGHYLAGHTTPFYVGLTSNLDSIKRPKKNMRRWVSHVGERQWFASIIESFADAAEAQLYYHQTVKHYGRIAIDKDVDAALVNVTMPSPAIDKVVIVETKPKKKRVAIKADATSNTNTSVAWSIYHCQHQDCQPDLPTPLNKLPALFGAAHKRHSV
jgi:hypothetical protein